MMRQVGFIAAVVLAAAVVDWPAHAQAGAPKDEPERADGARVFQTWCASCHGVTAQGNGPLAAMLKRPMPDLTQLAARNGGLFPAVRVRRIIDGRDIESHGDHDMPVWGTAFKSTKDGFSEESVRTRIDAVVRFLEAIQKRNAD